MLVGLGGSFSQVSCRYFSTAWRKAVMCVSRGTAFSRQIRACAESSQEARMVNVM